MDIITAHKGFEKRRWNVCYFSPDFLFRLPFFPFLCSLHLLFYNWQIGSQGASWWGKIKHKEPEPNVSTNCSCCNHRLIPTLADFEAHSSWLHWTQTRCKYYQTWIGDWMKDCNISSTKKQIYNKSRFLFLFFFSNLKANHLLLNQIPWGQNALSNFPKKKCSLKRAKKAQRVGSLHLNY